MLGFLTAAAIPRIGGVRKKIHDLAAWGMCFLLPLGILVGLSWQIPTLLRSIGLILFIISCILLALLFGVPLLRKHFLVFQLVYLGTFFFFLSAVAFG